MSLEVKKYWVRIMLRVYVWNPGAYISNVIYFSLNIKMIIMSQRALLCSKTQRLGVDH